MFDSTLAPRRPESGAVRNGRDCAARTPHSALRTPKWSRAFTLIELLVVISIIGLLMAIGLPAMRGMTGSNAIIAANRQFLDDLAYARQRAIGDHTTVFIVFVPTNVAQISLTGLDLKLQHQMTNLYTGQYTTYALLSLRQLGDQPGRADPKYLTGWRSLPNGVFFPPAMFAFAPPNGFYEYPVNIPPGMPFPVATNYPVTPPALPPLTLPCLAFNYLGQLISPFVYPNTPPGGTLAADTYIPLARGSIFFDPSTFAADVQVNPPGNSSNNIVYINALTGRAKVIQPQIQ
jgi:prepilin-type N-terminal cleavage/methylation domain-containing protein